MVLLAHCGDTLFKPRPQLDRVSRKEDEMLQREGPQKVRILEEAKAVWAVGTTGVGDANKLGRTSPVRNTWI